MKHIKNMYKTNYSPNNTHNFLFPCCRGKRMLILGILAISIFANLYSQDIQIPVAVHILRDDNGNNPRATSAQADTEISNLNDAYNYLDITFTKCSEQFIDNSQIWYQFDDGDDAQKLLLDPYCISNVVNLFITDLEGGGHGKAVFPYKQKDWVAIDYLELNTSTVVHEFGHYFGLHHTYSGVNTSNPASSNSLTIALAEGANGWKYGDFLIDTPLDPGNRDDYNDTCAYTGNQVDANGDTFHPDGKNYMGKGHNYCRNKFSSGQEARILEYIKRYRYYLECDNTSNNNLKCSNSTSVTSFPHNDDFERADVLNEHYWVQAREGDDMNWSTGPSTPSSSTGPDGAQSGQTFMYFESSLKYTSSDEAILLSPCYDFTGLTDADITFYYHMHGANTGTLKLDISVDDGVNWTNLFTISGEQHAYGSTPWTLKSINLNSYIRQKAQLRFKAIGTGSSKSDISIDNVTVSGSSNYPVSLVSFTAKVQDKSVLLNWETASELNHDFTAIEYSEDGKFYAEIGRRKGKGTSVTHNHYDFLHQNPNSGINYYRLRQVDLDGTINYSNIISILVKRRNPSFSISPSLVKNGQSVTIELPAGTGEEKISIDILNINGQVVQRMETMNDKNIILECNRLLNGIYLVRITGAGTGIQVGRFIKL